MDVQAKTVTVAAQGEMVGGRQGSALDVIVEIGENPAVEERIFSKCQE